MFIDTYTSCPDRVGSRGAHKRVIVKDVEYAGYRLDDVVLHEGFSLGAVAESFTAAPPIAEPASGLARFSSSRRRARRDRPAAGRPAVPTRVGTTLLGARPVDRLGGCRWRLRLCPHRSRRSRFTGAAPLRADLLALGNRSVRSGSISPLGGQCPQVTDRPVVCPGRPVNNWGAVGLSPDLLNRRQISSFFHIPDIPFTPARLTSARSSGGTMVASRAGRLVGVEVWGDPVAAASDGLPSRYSLPMRSARISFLPR